MLPCAHVSFSALNIRSNRTVSGQGSKSNTGFAAPGAEGLGRIKS